METSETVGQKGPDVARPGPARKTRHYTPERPDVNGPGPVSRDGLELVIRVTENSWFNLSADNSREQDFILPAGASKTFRAQTGFRLTIGNRRGTQLALNGRDLSLPPTPDNVVREFKITADTIE